MVLYNTCFGYRQILMQGDDRGVKKANVGGNAVSYTEVPYGDPSPGVIADSLGCVEHALEY